MTPGERITLREWLEERGVDWTKQTARAVEPAPAPAPVPAPEWPDSELGDLDAPRFTIRGIEFELQSVPSARLTRSFRKYLKDGDGAAEAALIWAAMGRLARLKWRYLLREGISDASLTRVCDVVIDELRRACVVTFPPATDSTLGRIVRFRVGAYANQRNVAIARLPTAQIEQRNREDWRLNSRPANPEYNPLAIAPQYASTGRSRRVMRVPWVDDEGTWKGERRPV